MADKDSFIHIARPVASAVGPQPSTAPLNVVVQPQVKPFYETNEIQSRGKPSVTPVRN